MEPDFEALALSDDLKEVVRELGYTRPTPVQFASIPVLLAGKDLIGQSKTGSGKTAAFALPILEHVEVDLRAPQALVLCPTRELCAQVAREIRKLGRRHAGLAVLELAGGQPIRPQLGALERGVHLVVGTPGRLLDHFRRGTLDTRAVRTVVLDEADRMLDMGFGADVEQILGELPAERQTALFSATFPKAIVALGRRFLQLPVRVSIDAPEQATADIEQLRLEVDPDGKFHALCWLLERYPHEAALVFCNFKTTVQELAYTLEVSGVSAARLDGDLDQFHRDQVLARFRNGSVRVLVATDVAGRGIDIPELDLVVNYEVHPQPEVYVHRIGRTGRAGKTGVAVSLTTPRQQVHVDAIEALTGTTLRLLRRTPDDDRGVEQLLRRLSGRPAMETLLISSGRKDKLRAGDVLGALTGEAGGLDGADIGKIEVQDHLTYVAVSRRVARRAADALHQGRIKGKKVRARLIGGGGRRR